MPTTAQSSRSSWLQTRSQWFAAVVCIAVLGAGVAPAAAQGRRVSKDLVERLDKASRGEATTDSVDVIVSGNSEFVARIARKHGASIKSSLKDGAVLTVDAGALQSMASDDEVGALTGDGDMHSQLAVATESTGAAALWAGEIAKIGAVTGRGVGVAIIDSGVDNHAALAGRILTSRSVYGHEEVGLH